VFKKNNGTNLNSKFSWSSAKVPGATDIAAWDSTVTGADTAAIGGNISWLGIRITNPGGLVTINGTADRYLTLGTGGIDMSASTQNLALNCAVILGAAQVWDITSGHWIAAAGVIGGAGTLSKNGLGTLSLTGVNTYTGGTVINAGIVQINSGSGLGSSSGLATINAGTLELLTAHTVSTTRAFQLGSATSMFQIDSSSSLTISGTISGTGSLNKTGVGTLILTGVNTYGGAGQTTAINGGTLQASRDNVLGNASTSLTFNGGTLLFSAGFSSARSIQFSGAGTINTNNNAVTLSGVISGGGAFTKTGAGTLTLSGTNTYSGGTIITGGNSSVLSISSASNSGTGAVTIDGGSVLMTTANLMFTNGIVLGSQGGTGQGDGHLVSGMINVGTGATLTLNLDGISEATPGTGRLEKIGGGTLILYPASTYTGGTYIHDGTVVAANATAFGPQVAGNTLTIDNGAKVLLAINGAFNLDVYIGNGGAAIGATSPTNTLFNNGVIANVAGQTGGFTLTSGITGGGGANTFVGNVTINSDAALSISRDVNLGAASNQLFLSNNATLMIQDGVNLTTNSPVPATFSTARQFNLLSGQATIEVDNTNNAVNPLPIALAPHTNTLTLDGSISGPGGLVKSGLGTLVLTNTANNYSGGTTINGGILSVAQPAALGSSSGALTINPSAVFRATASFIDSRLVTLGGTGGATSGGTFDVSAGVTENRVGVISGAGSLTKTGDGILQLGAVDTYTGGTYVVGGTLNITNDPSLGPAPDAGSALYGIHLSNGTTLQLLVNSTNGNRQIELLGGTATLNVGTGFTQQRNGLIFGSGGLIKAGGGETILTNANIYTGGTTINAGILQVNNATGSGTGTGPVTVNSGGVLSGLPTAVGFGAPGTIAGIVTVNAGGALDLRSGGTFTFGGLVLNLSAISNFQLGGLTSMPLLNITGTNALTLSGLSTINIFNFNGSITAGTYHLIDYVGTPLANLNNLQLGSTPGGAFTYSLSNNQTNGSIDLIVSTSSVQWGNDADGPWGTTANWTNNTVPNAAGAPANFLGAIQTSRTVTIDGAYVTGSLTFDNANSYTIASDGVSGHGLTLNNNGVANINVVSGHHTISADLVLANDLDIVAVGGTSLTINGAITETGDAREIYLPGAGTVTFGGAAANTYTGLTDLDAGTLYLAKTGGANAIGVGGLEIDGSAIVSLLAANQIADTALVNVNGTFAVNTFSETIGGLIGTGNVTIGVGGALTINVDTDTDSIFRGVISGAGTITKAGDGLLDLHNANTFGGAGQTVTIQAGTLRVDGDDNLGNSANSLTFTGGTLALEQDFSSARSVRLLGAAILDTNNNAATFSGLFSGDGTLTKTGDGTLTLSATNIYTGGTIITGGNGSAIAIARPDNLGTGSITISNGAALITTNSMTLTSPIVLGLPGGGLQNDGTLVSGILDVPTGTTLTLSTNGISELTSGTGRLEKIGGGTLFILSVNSYTGGTYIHDGSVVLASSSALGGPGAGNTLTIDNGARIIFAASGAANLPVFLGNSGAGAGTLFPDSVGFDNGVIANIPGQSGGFTLESGTIGLGGANTFAGNLTVNSGATLSISRDINLGAPSDQIFLNANSTLKIEDGVDLLTNTSVQATFASSRQVNLVSGQVTIEVDNTFNAANPLSTTLAGHTNILTLNGVVTGSGGLVKTGAGILVLGNVDNNFTGGTTINAGTLSIANGSSLGDARYGLTINPDATFQVTGTFTTSRAVTVGGTGGPSSGATFDITDNNNETRLGVITGGGSLTKTGSGTLSLLGVSDYTGGTYINSGTVAINNPNSLGAASGGLTLGPATIEVLSDITSNRNIVIGNSQSTVDVDPGATYVLSGTLSGGGTLNKTDEGVLALTGTNTYTGGTTIDGGVVVVNSAASLGNGGPLILNAATLQVASGYATTRNMTLGSASSTVEVNPAQSYMITGVISGTGSLTKNGTGTLTLTGTNAFTGDMTVNYGTLTVAGASGSALGTTASITVNDSSTLLLGASNQISNTAPITLNGGTIAKGNFSEGTASSAGFGALTLAGPGSNLDFGTGTVGILTFATFIPGVDTLAIDHWTGAINTLGTASSDRIIFNADQSANLASFTFTGYTGAMEFNLGNGYWEIVPTGIAAVPEPSTWGAAVLGTLAIGWRILVAQRARKKNNS
jgi:fibronectin-binding autotransporter adhesin